MIILDLQTVRIDISSKIKDTRASQLLTSLSQLELSSELESLQIVDSYTIQADLTAATIKKAANNLIDFKKEQLMIATNLHDFDFAIEIGFLPGDEEDGEDCSNGIGDRATSAFCSPASPVRP